MWLMFQEYASLKEITPAMIKHYWTEMLLAVQVIHQVSALEEVGTVRHQRVQEFVKGCSRGGGVPPPKKKINHVYLKKKTPLNKSSQPTEPSYFYK